MMGVAISQRCQNQSEFLAVLAGLGLLDAGQVRHVEAEPSLIRRLVGLGWVESAVLFRLLCAHSDTPPCDMDLLAQADLPTGGFGRDFMRYHGIVPYRDSNGQNDNGQMIAIANPFEKATLAALRLAAPSARLVLAPLNVIEATLARWFDGKNGGTGTSETAPMPLQDDSESQAVRSISLMLDQAVQRRASDIHLEACVDGMVIRFRIDGILEIIGRHPLGLAPMLVARVKILAGLDVAEKRLPQDGRSRMTIAGRQVEIRVSSVPTLYGESLALRLLDKAQASLNLATLGLDDATLRGFGQVLARPHGLVLVTGPTGSGKTTTLYAALNQLNQTSRKIITVEDPVEYELAGINQIAVKPAIGLDFSTLLRHVLRQDPDIIFVGEIRDSATAAIAVQAALTGHLVLSSLHTNDAASAAMRLIDMGVEPYLLAASLTGVLAQRLVRVFCPACHGSGCGECRQTGWHGRKAVGEYLAIDATQAELIRQQASLAEMRSAANIVSLRQHALKMVEDGITSHAEALRATGAEA